MHTKRTASMEKFAQRKMYAVDGWLRSQIMVDEVLAKPMTARMKKYLDSVRMASTKTGRS